MKNNCTLFLLLNIYSCFFFGIQAQELSLSLKAEKEIPEGVVDSLQLPASYKDFISLKNETDTLHLKLQRMGFIESELLQLKKENDSSYTAAFFLGRKYNNIKVYYSEKDFSKKELQHVASQIDSSYFILPFETIPTALRKLTAYRNAKGNAFARVRLTAFNNTGAGNLSATLLIENGKLRTVDSIVLKGYEKFPKSYLKYYAGVRKGKLFDQKKLLAQNENLNSLGFVSSIKPPEALFREDSTTVYFYLEKEENNLFDGILGFATDEESQKLTFNGYLNLELNNNLNYGEQLLINYKSDGEKQINFKTKLTLPYLFSSPFGLSGELMIFKRDSTFITTEQQLRSTYQLDTRSTLYVGYKGYESSNLLDEVIAGIPIEDFTSRFFIFGGNYKKPQNRKLFPVKTAIYLDMGIGSRKQKSESEDQIGFTSVISNIFNLNYRNSLFVQNSTSALFSDSYLINELFRFGGINSIRGFDENSIDASLFSVLNTEYRYQFNDGVYLHSIIDVGYFENQTISLKEKIYSFGLGLGLNTKAGIFRFNIANGNRQNTPFNLTNTKVHISISSKF
ncbi:POTRA domain-containing protein [Aequorivita flava]|uniref:POTRA domain-containing protein n=1 Tax=Aequorivita flava TaxID=3114371 RepID=A0AB35YRK7_9FLAO